MKTDFWVGGGPDEHLFLFFDCGSRLCFSGFRVAILRSVLFVFFVLEVVEIFQLFLVELAADWVLRGVVVDHVDIVLVELHLVCEDIIGNVAVVLLDKGDIEGCLLFVPFLVDGVSHHLQYVHLICEVASEVFHHHPLIDIIIVLKHRCFLRLSSRFGSRVLSSTLSILPLGAVFG